MRLEDFVARWPDAAPMLTFGEEPPESWARALGRADLHVIGSDGNASPIVLRPDGRVVVLDHDDDFAERMLGSSLDRLDQALTAYQRHIASIQRDSGEDAWLDEQRLVELAAALQAADPAAWEPFWSGVLENERSAIAGHAAGTPNAIPARLQAARGLASIDPWGARDPFGRIVVEDPTCVEAYLGRADALALAREYGAALQDLRYARLLLVEQGVHTADLDRRIVELEALW